MIDLTKSSDASYCFVRRTATRGLERQAAVQDFMKSSFRGKVRGKDAQDMALVAGQGFAHPCRIFASEIIYSVWFGPNSKAAHYKHPRIIT